MTLIETDTVIRDSEGNDLAAEVAQQMQQICSASRMICEVLPQMLAEDYVHLDALELRDPADRERGGGDVSYSRLLRVIDEDSETLSVRRAAEERRLESALWGATQYYRHNREAFVTMAEVEAAAVLAMRQLTVFIDASGVVRRRWNQLVR